MREQAAEFLFSAACYVLPAVSESYAVTRPRCWQIFAVELDVAGADDRALYEQLRALGWDLCGFEPSGDKPVAIETQAR